MKYTYNEVLDIIKSVTDKEPQDILDQWIDKKSNVPLDLTKYQYAHFVYTFPFEVDGRKVGEITLASLSGHSQSFKDELMLKYFGREDHDNSWWTFSHDTYLDCFLTIRKEFQLPEIVEGMFADTLQAQDDSGKPFDFKMSYGNPEKEKDSYVYHQWVDSRNCYRFDNGVNIVINHNQIKGWLLGEKINQNIQTRLIPFLRNNKIEEVL
jgi:hypothetical protein